MSLRLFPLILLLGTNSAIYIDNNVKGIEDLNVELLQLREDMVSKRKQNCEEK